MIGWWMSVLVLFGLVGIGLAALVAPGRSAAQYGIVIADPRALGLIRAMGIRDLALGLLLALLALGHTRDALAWGMFAVAPIALVDLAVVTAGGDRTGPGRAPYLHAAGAIGLLVTGAVLRAGL